MTGFCREDRIIGGCRKYWCELEYGIWRCCHLFVMHHLPCFDSKFCRCMPPVVNNIYGHEGALLKSPSKQPAAKKILHLYPAPMSCSNWIFLPNLSFPPSFHSQHALWAEGPHCLLQHPPILSFTAFSPIKYLILYKYLILREPKLT